MNKNKLILKINNKEAIIGVIGLGYVGLPLVLEITKSGFSVIGLDTDQSKVEELKNGHSYISGINEEELTSVLIEKRFTPSADFSLLNKVDAIIICVPTPLSKTKEPDLSFIKEAVSNIKKYFHPDTLIVLESSTYPGTTEEIIEKEINSLRYTAGEDFFLCHSPERVDPGNKDYKIKNTPKIIGGKTPSCLKTGIALYSKFIENLVPVKSIRAAETVKLVENTFRAVNIGLCNETALACEKLNLDVWEILSAAASKPFGYLPFYPGPGIGGHCIPIDPLYLSWKAKTVGFHHKFIELANDINEKMPEYVLDKAAAILNIIGKSLNGSRVLLLGMAYKKDVNDYRESPGIKIYQLLKEKGAEVEYHDPLIPSLMINGEKACSHALTDLRLKSADLVLLCTDHSIFDYNRIAEHSRLILDTRNAFKELARDHIFKIGIPLPGPIKKSK